jgi:hypothetical protein
MGLAILSLFDACSFDEGKLRRHARGDAASATDVAAMPADTARTGGDVAAREVFSDTMPDSLAKADGSAWGGAEGGLGGAGGSGVDGSSGADGAADRLPGGDGPENGEEAGSLVSADTAGPADDGAAVRAELGEDAADAPWTEDSGGQTIDAPAEADVALDAGAPPAIDALSDTLAIDARGKRTCPTSISGSLDRADLTQVGRLSRVDSASVCGVLKSRPGNGADRTYSHLYDVYHFINVANAPVCFTFTLTYSATQELHAAAYSVFDPTDITTGYLGDVGDTLTPPQAMGITVGPAETIDVVVYAVAIGTAPAGAYTLGCSAE